MRIEECLQDIAPSARLGDGSPPCESTVCAMGERDVIALGGGLPSQVHLRCLEGTNAPHAPTQ